MAQQFTDNAGKTWEVAVTIGSIERVRRLLELDLLDTQAVVPRLLLDPVLLVNTAYVLTHRQSDKQSQEAFGECLGGDSIRTCRDAVIEALADFFDDPADRRRMKAAAGAMQMILRGAREKLATRAESPQVKEQIASALADFDASPGSSPDGAESTPAA